jgi:CheY-like chemotaxis protein
MKTVLLVEDDAKIAMAFGVRLKSMGYVVVAAADAVAAVSQAKKHKPDVVLLDISLPGGDGFMVAERLHNLPDGATTPIIFITASQRPDLQGRAMKQGAVAFLRKPFHATELADAIDSALAPSDQWQPYQDATEVLANAGIRAKLAAKAEQLREETKERADIFMLG